MKFSFLALAFMLITYIKAQDLIVMDNDIVIEAKVLNISSEKIDYKRFDYLDGPTLSVDIKSVKQLVYENGSEENLDLFKKKGKRLSEEV